MARTVLRGIAGQEWSPGHPAGTDAGIENAVRPLAATGHHPVATCPMGADHEPDAVRDNALRVRGVEGLHEIDGSSLPSQVGGNMNAPIIMIAENAADMVPGRSPLPPEDPRKPK
ncbi:MAG: GMC oxidoreductase [Gammaproteobacteria bacterium]|nr:GMC oxidoreductase [Gammaproteobacteria bacterium]